MPPILSTSSMTLGVCMTVLSLTKLSDDPLPYWLLGQVVALTALLFLASCFCSLVSL